jgi:hypothetical protein
VPEGLQLARPELGPGAGLQADTAGLQAFEKRQELTATELRFTTAAPAASTPWS